MNQRNDSACRILGRKYTLQSDKSGSPKHLKDESLLKSIFKLNYVAKGYQPTKKSSFGIKTPSASTNHGLAIPFFASRKSSSLRMGLDQPSGQRSPINKTITSPLGQQSPCVSEKRREKSPGWLSQDFKVCTPLSKMTPNDNHLYHPKRIQEYINSKSKDRSEKKEEDDLKVFKSTLAREQRKAKLVLDVVEVVDVSVLKNINLNLLIEQTNRLSRLYSLEDDIHKSYEMLHEYTDAIQQTEFKEIENLVKSPLSEFDLLASIKLEIIGVLSIFFCLVEESHQEKFNPILQLLLSNAYSFLHILKIGYAFTGQSSCIKSINEVLESEDAVGFFSRIKNPLTCIKSNTQLLKTQLETLIDSFSPSMATELLKGIRDKRLVDTIDATLESFYKLLNAKTDVKDADMLTNSRAHPDFIIQPYEFTYLLPPKESKKEYTLVIEIDKALVQVNEQNRKILFRPHLYRFLEDMYQRFEVVVFTAQEESKAEFILNTIDPQNKIKHRLYRSNLSVRNKQHIKDLDRLGRDLAKIIIVDSEPLSFQLHPENGIYIRPWNGDSNDTALESLQRVLKDMSDQSNRDIRDVLKGLKKKNP